MALERDPLTGRFLKPGNVPAPNYFPGFSNPHPRRHTASLSSIAAVVLVLVVLFASLALIAGLHIFIRGEEARQAALQPWIEEKTTQVDRLAGELDSCRVTLASQIEKADADHAQAERARQAASAQRRENRREREAYDRQWRELIELLQPQK
jgi:hypothetical protein